MTVVSEVREITPEQAQEILQKNTHNRNVRRSRVNTYARDMAAGKWQLNGDSIKFNGKGQLYDGQHRLLACVLANKPFKTVVVSGLTDEAHRTIDVGATRTMADELKWRGEKWAAELAAILNLTWNYDNGTLFDPRASAGRHDLLDLLKREPEIRDAVKVRHVAKQLAILGTPLAVTYHLVSREHGPEAADSFIEHLGAGTDYGEGDPCLALRSYATTMAAARSMRPTGPEWLAVIIKAANHFLLDKSVSKVGLRWRRHGPSREAFPTVISRDMVADDD